MRALIIDDEPLARSRLRRLLTEQSVDVAGEAADSTEGLRAIRELKPDLVFVDIQMPGMSGLEMARALREFDPPPLLVFVTGYSEHAVSAFELTAIDYLLKPVAAERLAATLIRAADRLSERAARALVAGMGTRPAARRSSLDRLPIRSDYSVRLLPTREILCAVSRNRKVSVVTADAEYAVSYSLRQLEAMLAPERFLRVHDSCIVNLQSIQALEFLGDHSYEVRLANGLRLPVSRARYPELSRRLGLDPSVSS
jgi:DNA-binding LytR/AlgR family response regulator